MELSDLTHDDLNLRICAIDQAVALAADRVRSAIAAANEHPQIPGWRSLYRPEIARHWLCRRQLQLARRIVRAQPAYAIKVMLLLGIAPPLP